MPVKRHCRYLSEPGRAAGDTVISLALPHTPGGTGGWSQELTVCQHPQGARASGHYGTALGKKTTFWRRVINRVININMETQNFSDVETKKPGNEDSLNLRQRIYGVLLGGPRRAFEDIVARPRVTAIIVLLLSVQFLVALPIIPKIKEFTLWNMQNNPAIPDMPAQAVSMATTMAVVGLLANSVLLPPVMWLIMTLLLKIYNIFAGEKTPFRILFAVTVYSYLPLLLAFIIQAALIMTSPAQNMGKISTSLSLLLPGGQQDRLYMILAQIDPFSIWGLVLLAVGSSVAMKVPVAKTGIYLGILWIIYVLVIGLFAPLQPAAI